MRKILKESDRYQRRRSLGRGTDVVSYMMEEEAEHSAPREMVYIIANITWKITQYSASSLFRLTNKSLEYSYTRCIPRRVAGGIQGGVSLYCGGTTVGGW